MDDSTGPGILAELFDPLAPPDPEAWDGDGDPGSTAADMIFEVPKFLDIRRFVVGIWSVRSVDDVVRKIDLIR